MPGSPDLFFAGGECLTKHGVWVRRTSLGEDVAETFTRSGTVGKAQGPDVLLYGADANVVRSSYPLVSGSRVPALLTEDARTNVCLQSEDFSTTWSIFGASSSSYNSDTAPDGAVTADTIGDANAAGGTLWRQSFTVSNDSTEWTFSLFVKKSPTALTAFPRIVMAFSGGTPISPAIGFDTEDGTIAEITSGAGPTRSGVEDHGGHYRFWMTAANNGSGNTTLDVNVYPAYSATVGGSIDGTLQDSIVVWGAQLENADTPSSYIPTTTTSQTRNAETFTFPIGFAPQEMTVYVKWVVGQHNPSGIGWLRLIELGDPDSGAGGFNMMFSNSTAHRIDAKISNNGTTAQPGVTVTGNGFAPGDLMEAMATFAADGTVTPYYAINGGAAVAGSAGSAVGLPSSWTVDTLFVMSAQGGIHRNYGSVLAIKGTRGVKTLAEMRLLS